MPWICDACDYPGLQYSGDDECLFCRTPRGTLLEEKYETGIKLLGGMDEALEPLKGAP